MHRGSLSKEALIRWALNSLTKPVLGISKIYSGNNWRDMGEFLRMRGVLFYIISDNDFYAQTLIIKR